MKKASTAGGTLADETNLDSREVAEAIIPVLPDHSSA